MTSILLLPSAQRFRMDFTLRLGRFRKVCCRCWSRSLFIDLRPTFVSVPRQTLFCAGSPGSTALSAGWYCSAGAGSLLLQRPCDEAARRGPGVGRVLSRSIGSAGAGRSRRTDDPRYFRAPQRAGSLLGPPHVLPLSSVKVLLSSARRSPLLFCGCAVAVKLKLC